MSLSYKSSAVYVTGGRLVGRTAGRRSPERREVNHDPLVGLDARQAENVAFLTDWPVEHCALRVELYA